MNPDHILFPAVQDLPEILGQERQELRKDLVAASDGQPVELLGATLPPLRPVSISDSLARTRSFYEYAATPSCDE